MPQASHIDDHLGCGLPVLPETTGDCCLTFDGLVCWVSLNIMCWKKRTTQFYLIAETLGGEKSVGEEALGVVICQPPPPFYESFEDQTIEQFHLCLFFYFLNIPLCGYLSTTSSLAQMIITLDSLYFAEISYLVLKTSSRGHVCIVLQVLYPTHLRVLGKVLYQLNIRYPPYF